MGYDRDLNKAIAMLEEETVKFVSNWKRISSKEALQYMRDYGDCRVAEIVNQVKGTYCMLPKKASPKQAPNPTKDTRDSYVTAATDKDAMAAMNLSAMQMIERIADQKKLSMLNSYALASLAMDARIGRVESGAVTIHNLMPRSLWVKKA